MDWTFYALVMLLGIFVIVNFGGSGGDDDEE